MAAMTTVIPPNSATSIETAPVIIKTDARASGSRTPPEWRALKELTGQANEHQRQRETDSRLPAPMRHCKYGPRDLKTHRFEMRRAVHDGEDAAKHQHQDEGITRKQPPEDDVGRYHA